MQDLPRVRGYNVRNIGTHILLSLVPHKCLWAPKRILTPKDKPVEPLFAEAKDWHGMRRFRLRRLEKVNIEALPIASGQNVKRLLGFGSRRPKKLAQAAALRPPTTTDHKISRAREHRAERSWSPSRGFFNSLGPAC